MNDRKAPPADDREWAAQERGMRAARGHRTGASDPATESYRRVAMAVASTPHREPSAEFAAGVMQQIARREAGIERALFRSLLLVLAAAAVVMTALYGGQWWRAMQEASSGTALPWLMAGAGCIALSWIASQLQQLLATGALAPRS